MRDRVENAVEQRVRAVRAICANPRARRQMLWLRAKEKGDEATARDIERSEPALSDWMLAVKAHAAGLGSDRERAELYGRLSDERFALFVAGLDSD